MQIDVTAGDIRVGHWGSACDCPVALAIGRHFEGEEIRVGCSAVFRYHGPRGYQEEMVLPTVAQEFISRFDTGKDVEPFSFALDA